MHAYANETDGAKNTKMNSVIVTLTVGKWFSFRLVDSGFQELQTFRNSEKPHSFMNAIFLSIEKFLVIYHITLPENLTVFSSMTHLLNDCCSSNFNHHCLSIWEQTKLLVSWPKTSFRNLCLAILWSSISKSKWAWAHKTPIKKMVHGSGWSFPMEKNRPADCVPTLSSC